jgi:hypothetical protein
LTIYRGYEIRGLSGEERNDCLTKKIYQSMPPEEKLKIAPKALLFGQTIEGARPSS